MKRYISYIYAAFSSVILLSCSDRLSDDTGYLAVALSEDLSESLIVKSGIEEGGQDMPAVQVEPYAIKVLDASGAVVAEVADHRTTADTPIKLLMGKYTVIAQNREVPNASFEDGFFGGSASVSIKAEEVRTIDIDCGRTDCKFSVEFPEEFESLFTEYYVEVTNGEGERLRLTSIPDPENPNQRGFDAKASFKVTGTLTWNLYMRNTDSLDENAGVYTYTKTISEVIAGQHYHLVFSLAEEELVDGVFALKVRIDGEMVSNSHDLILDFDMEGLPSYRTSAGWEIKDGLTFPVGNSDPAKILVFDIPSKVRNLIITHANEKLSGLGIPKSLDLVDASADDIAGLAAAGIRASALTSESVRCEIDITSLISALTIGHYDIRFLAIDQKGHFVRPSLAFEITSDVEAEAFDDAFAWAKFAELEGRYFSSDVPSGLTFQYKLENESEWTSVPASKIRVNESELTFSTRIDGLEPLSHYQYKAVTDKDQDTHVYDFYTESAETIDNLNFDSWYTDGSVWYPNLDLDSHYIWDSANKGTSTLGLIPTTPEENDLAIKGPGKAAARLETMLVKMIVQKLAAGNIYIGKFGKVDGMGAELDWGTPFSSRPLALRGYFKYQPKRIDMAEGKPELKGKMDECQILMFLADGEGMFNINTNAKKFVIYDTEPRIIAFGAHYSDQQNDGYVKVTIPLVYRSLDRIPTYAVVVGAASRYGDYFTGGVGSVLLLDEFELVYDPADLTEDEYNQVFSNFR